MRRHRKSLWANGVLSMAAAVLIGLCCTAAASLLLAALIFYVMRDMSMVKAFAAAALSVGAYTGAYIYGKFRRRRGLFGGSVCGAFMYIVTAVCGLVILGEMAGIKKLLLLTVFGAAGGVAGVNSKRPKCLRD